MYLYVKMYNDFKNSILALAVLHLRSDDLGGGRMGPPPKTPIGD